MSEKQRLPLENNPRVQQLQERRKELEDNLRAAEFPLEASDVYTYTLELTDIYATLARYDYGSDLLPENILGAYTSGLNALVTSTLCDMASPNTYVIFTDLSNRQQRQLDYIQNLYCTPAQ